MTAAMITRAAVLDEIGGALEVGDLELGASEEGRGPRPDRGERCVPQRLERGERIVADPSSSVSATKAPASSKSSAQR